APADPAKRQEELKKFGIHFDDDYDYMQHLKKRENDVVWEYMENPNQARKQRAEDEKPGPAPKLVLPSSVFASEFEESEGMLNKAAPQTLRLDWDPDVVAALDSDCENEEELDDDFVMQAMAEGDSDDDEEWDGEGSDEDMDFDSDDLNDEDGENEDELMDRLAPLMRERRFDDEEVKSRFTEYSMSSSV
ncbi:hypothetical protein KR032_008127, partial [Drosophila birchii]